MTTDTQTLPVTARTSGLRSRRILIAFAATLVVLIALAAVGSYLYASSNAGRILPGVSIGGVSVAGLTPEEAKAKLQTSLPKRRRRLADRQGRLSRRTRFRTRKSVGRTTSTRRSTRR